MFRIPESEIHRQKDHSRDRFPDVIVPGSGDVEEPIIVADEIVEADFDRYPHCCTGFACGLSR
jgi:hypothetical protein